MMCAGVIIAMTRSILDARHIRVKYGERVAVSDLSFQLRAGEILGFLGPNGAGKTTAIRVLTTILQPTEGSFSVGDVEDDRPEGIRRLIGVLPESQGFPSHLTAQEYLQYQASFYGIARGQAAAKASTLLEEVGLGSRQRSLISSFSRGMRQRLGIARALVNDPLVVFLDEPTLGLDPRGQQELMELIEQMAHQRNAGVIVCSHLLDEVEQLCGSLLILRDGHVVAKGRVEDVVGRAKEHALRIRVAIEDVARAASVVRSALPGAEVDAGSRRDGWILVRAHAIKDDPAAPNRLLRSLLAEEVPILAFESSGGRLHEAFLQLTEAAR